MSISTWEPKPEDIIRLYTTLEKKGILELEWQCPGRRSPSVHSGDSESFERKPSDFEDGMSKKMEPNEFDFDDLGPETGTPSPKITPRRRYTPGSAGPKRVARLDKVMFDIRRYRKLDEIEKKTQKMTIKNEPKKPNTSSESPSSSN